MTMSSEAEAAVAAALHGWDGDVLALHELSGGHAMLLVGHALFVHHGLYEALHLDRLTVRRFRLALEAAYGVGQPS